MGSGSPVVCDECDEEFMAISGAGFMGTAVRCVDCGEPAFAPRDGWESDDTPALPEHCECGGTFSEDGPFRCPNCGKLFSSSDLEDLGSADGLLWD
jgi:hypothetical protein